MKQRPRECAKDCCGKPSDDDATCRFCPCLPPIPAEGGSRARREVPRADSVLSSCEEISPGCRARLSGVDRGVLCGARRRLVSASVRNAASGSGLGAAGKLRSCVQFSGLGAADRHSTGWAASLAGCPPTRMDGGRGYRRLARRRRRCPRPSARPLDSPGATRRSLGSESASCPATRCLPARRLPSQGQGIPAAAGAGCQRVSSEARDLDSAGQVRVLRAI